MDSNPKEAEKKTEVTKILKLQKKKLEMQILETVTELKELVLNRSQDLKVSCCVYVVFACGGEGGW
jgi:hypothetical protein